jgi:acetyl-CoA acetyltransferase
MTDPVGVAGISQIGCAAAIPDRTLEEPIFEAASSALADAGVAWRDIDSVVIAASDLVDGRVISSMVTSGPAGGYMKDLLNVASTGDHALVLAVLQILSGLAEAALVLSWSKCSAAPIPQVERLSLDPFYGRHLGIDGLVSAALQASAYRGRRSTSSGRRCR